MIGRGILLAVLGTELLVGASPSTSAQRRSGDGYGRPVQTPENMARLSLFRFAGCARRSASMTVGKLLSTGIGSGDEAKQVRSLRTVARECYGADWPNYASTDIRNSLAEIDYRERYRSAPVVASAKAPDSFGVVPAGTKGSPEQERVWYLAALARCVTYVDAGQAHDFVTGPIGVPEEDKRLDKVRPAIVKCGAGSISSGLTSAVFRGYLDDALLMMAEARK